MISLKALENKDLLEVIAYENEYFNNTNYEIFVERYLDNPLYEIYGIYLTNLLVGYIIIWLDEDKSQIYSMLINEDYRQKGYAYQALRKLEETLKDKHINEWTLEVRESNLPAIALYEKLGFKKVSVRKNYYNDHENALLMYKKI